MTLFRDHRFSEQEQVVFTTTLQFVSDRFEERAIADWAADKARTRAAERAALYDAYNHAKVDQPWREFWGWLFESWANEPPHDHEIRPHRLGDLIGKGDRSHTIIKGIVDAVRPYPSVGVRTGKRDVGPRRPVKPRAVSDIAFIHVSSPNMLDERPLGLAETEADFLISLAHELETAVRYGIDVARKLSGDPEKGLWRLGELVRVYPVDYTDESGHREDPDRYNGGVAPATKLLFTVVDVLAAKDAASARALVGRWGSDESLVFIRLWAAFARDAGLVPADAVARFLTACSPARFWKLDAYPEIAEVRARRFADLPDPAQFAVTRQLMQLPPRSYWRGELEDAKVQAGRRYWAVRELRRIEVAGGVLPKRAKKWLNEHVGEFPELAQMTSIEEGFYRGMEVRSSTTKADTGYDALSGKVRLEALEAALKSKWSFQEDKAGEARHWMALSGSLEKIVADLEVLSDAGAQYSKVWDILGWARPAEATRPEDADGRRKLASRVLALIAKLPKQRLAESIDAFADWMSAWERHLPQGPATTALWFSLWPHAVAKTNEKGLDLFDFDTAFDKPFEGRERRYQLDTLNNATGKLVGLFLEWLPDLTTNPKPFDDDDLRKMRAAIFEAEGRAGAVGRSRLLQALGWMLAADVKWSKANLVRIMREPSDELPYLWRALSWQTQFRAVLELGPEMADVAVDPSFDRDTRKAMAFSLVAHVLNAYWDGREPALPTARVSQMLRSCDEEVRAHCANLIAQFVREVAGKPPVWLTQEIFAGMVYERAAARVLTVVWPYERSLTTPGVAKAFADLPAASGDAFAEAVDAIERFLVPFEAWSMMEFGLYSSKGEDAKLETINTEEKAAAFLKLLDLSIGRNERAIVPYDLSAALLRIETVAPALTEDRRFRRLATLTRR